MKKYLIIIAMLPLAIAAQNSPFVREVQVERDYMPSVSEATKLPNSPKIQSALQEKPDAAYADWANIAEVNTPKQNLPAAELATPQYSRADRFIRLGAGNYTSFLGDLFLPVINKERTNWTIDATHRSSFGKVRLDNDRKVQAKNNDNRLHTTFDHRFDNLILSADARFNRRDYNYYAVNNLVPATSPESKLNTHFSDFAVGAGLRSLYLPENDLDFNVSLNYNYFKPDAVFAEHHTTAKGGFVKKIAEDNIGVDFAFDMFSYTDAPTFWTSDFSNYAAFKINPYYTHFADKMEIRLGLNAYFSGKGEYPAALSPDVKITFNAIENRLQLLAYAQGDYALNSAARITQENPYIFPFIRVADTYTPLDFGAGVKGKITDNIVAKGSLGYKKIMNEYFYYPISDGKFDVYDGKVWLFYSNVSLEGNWSDRFNTLLSWNYNHYNEDVQMWRNPLYEIRLSGNYKITDKINLSASGYVATRKFNDEYYSPNPTYIPSSDFYDRRRMKRESVIDFSLGGTYKFNDFFTAFLQANNIFAHKYHIWYGYNAQRFNAMAGVTISF